MSLSGILRRDLFQRVWFFSKTISACRAFHTAQGRLASTPASKLSSSESTDPEEANRRGRLELAVAYRALERLNLHEGVCNHLSLMVPAASGVGEVMLIIPYGRHWSKVTSSSLVGVNDKGVIVEGDGQPELSAVSIHLGLHLANPNAKCVMHTHAPYATSLGLLEDPRLLNFHQTAVRFQGRIAYDRDYTGYARETDEGRRLATVLGDKDVLMMCNHGVITTAPTVSLAFDLMYYLERVCMFQMMAYATGRKLSIIPDNVANYSSQFIQKEEGVYATSHFNATMEKIVDATPDVAN